MWLTLGIAGALGASPEGDPLTLDRAWRTVDVPWGQVLDLQLVGSGAGEPTFSMQRGGPDGLVLTDTGRVSWVPSEADEGLWRVPILLEQDGEHLWTGLVVRVEGPPPPAFVPVVPSTVSEPVDDGSRAGLYRFAAIQQCMITPGAQVTMARNDRTDWLVVGRGDVVVTGSPSIAFTCSGGDQRIRWFFGVDSAPVATYLTPRGGASNLLGFSVGLDLGPPRFRVGPIASAGLLSAGAGVRVMVLPWLTDRGASHGFELRGLLHPVGLAGSVMVGYTHAIGRR